MGLTKRMYEEMLDEQEAQARKAICPFDAALAEAKGDELLASIIMETREESE